MVPDAEKLRAVVQIPICAMEEEERGGGLSSCSARGQTTWAISSYAIYIIAVGALHA